MFRHGAGNFYRTGPAAPAGVHPGLRRRLAFYGLVPELVGDCCLRGMPGPQKRARRLAEGRREAEQAGTATPPAGSSLRQRLWRALRTPARHRSPCVLLRDRLFHCRVGHCQRGGDHSVPWPYTAAIKGAALWRPLPTGLFFCMDTACVLIFAGEYTPAAVCCPQPLPLPAECDEPHRCGGHPALLHWALHAQERGCLRRLCHLLGVPRLFRIFKFSRHSQGLQFWATHSKSCASELGFLLFSLTMAIIIFATVMFYAEGHKQDQLY